MINNSYKAPIDYLRDDIEKNRKFSGWYYDDQMAVYGPGRLTTLSLHANSTYVPRSHANGMQYSEWSYDTPDLNFKDSELFYPYGNYARDEESALDSDNVHYSGTRGYYFEPLCTAIVSEDVAVSIANSWSEMGGDMIGQLWNNFKQYAPYASSIADSSGRILESISSRYLKDKIDKNGNIINEDDNSIFTNTAINLATRLKAIGQAAQDTKNQDIMNDYLNRSLVMQGTRFSYYQGTGVNFNNMVMKFTIFPKWKYNKKTGNITFLTVPNQIANLYPYFIGEYVDEPIADVLKKGLGDYIGWQMPPGGFRAAIKDVDNVQKGTLKLKIGSLYSISNLVVENVQFNFSKEVVKCPDPAFFNMKRQFGISYNDAVGNNGSQSLGNVAGYNTEKSSTSLHKEVNLDSKNSDNVEQSTHQGVGTVGLISPLFCEVTLQLRPVTKYSSQTMRKFFNSSNMATDNLLVQNGMVSALKEGHDSMKLRFVTRDLKQKETERRKLENERTNERYQKLISDSQKGGIYSSVDEMVGYNSSLVTSPVLSAGEPPIFNEDSSIEQVEDLMNKVEISEYKTKDGDWNKDNEELKAAKKQLEDRGITEDSKDFDSELEKTIKENYTKKAIIDQKESEILAEAEKGISKEFDTAFSDFKSGHSTESTKEIEKMFESSYPYGEFLNSEEGKELKKKVEEKALYDTEYDIGSKEYNEYVEKGLREEYYEANQDVIKHSYIEDRISKMDNDLTDQVNDYADSMIKHYNDNYENYCQKWEDYVNSLEEYKEKERQVDDYNSKITEIFNDRMTNDNYDVTIVSVDGSSYKPEEFEEYVNNSLIRKQAIKTYEEDTGLDETEYKKLSLEDRNKREAVAAGKLIKEKYPDTKISFGMESKQYSQLLLESKEYSIVMDDAKINSIVNEFNNVGKYPASTETHPSPSENLSVDNLYVN